MATKIKKQSISTKHFEYEVIKVINEIKDMENLNEEDRQHLLTLLRQLHVNCLEWFERT
jgi:hypothetical protein